MYIIPTHARYSPMRTAFNSSKVEDGAGVSLNTPDKASDSSTIIPSITPDKTYTNSYGRLGNGPTSGNGYYVNLISGGGCMGCIEGQSGDPGGSDPGFGFVHRCLSSCHTGGLFFDDV